MNIHAFCQEIIDVFNYRMLSQTLLQLLHNREYGYLFTFGNFINAEYKCVAQWFGLREYGVLEIFFMGIGYKEPGEMNIEERKMAISQPYKSGSH